MFFVLLRCAVLYWLYVLILLRGVAWWVYVQRAYRCRDHTGHSDVQCQIVGVGLDDRLSQPGALIWVSPGSLLIPAPRDEREERFANTTEASQRK